MSYDENYSDYLKGMGIPFFVVPMILGSKETITITKPDDPDDGFWSFMTETGMHSTVDNCLFKSCNHC